MIDSHVHLVDFLQDSEGFDKLLDEMDKFGIDRAVVFGLPLVKKWDDLVERFAGRFMIGSDLTGHFSGLGPTMKRYRGLLEGLSTSARQKVAKGNAERVFFGNRQEMQGLRRI